jgi:hypothetical protein
MSRFGNKAKTSTPAPQPKAAPVKTSIFGGITKPKTAFSKNYITPGRYPRLEVVKIKGGIMADGDHQNEPYALCVVKVLESHPPVTPDDEANQPEGIEMSMVKFFAGKAAKFRLAEWRNFCCAVLGIDEKTVDWPNLPEDEVVEFQGLCDEMLENPDQYYGTVISLDCSRNDKGFTQTTFRPFAG